MICRALENLEEVDLVSLPQHRPKDVKNYVLRAINKFLNDAPPRVIGYDVYDINNIFGSADVMQRSHQRLIDSLQFRIPLLSS